MKSCADESGSLAVAGEAPTGRVIGGTDRSIPFTAEAAIVAGYVPRRGNEDVHAHRVTRGTGDVAIPRRGNEAYDH